MSPRIWKVLAIVLGVVVIGATGWALTGWGTQDRTVQKPVAQQWMEAIAQYGIEPVYPPQEDFLVGDVYAFITSDNQRDVGAEPLPLRALKLDHLDLTGELRRAYSATYRFPDTQDRPADERSFWKQGKAAESLFKVESERTDLPLALLPGFTLATIRSAEGDASSPLGAGFGAVFGVRAGSSRTTSMKVEGVETYGLPAIPAIWALDEFCRQRDVAPVCTEAGLRAQLSNIIGKQIFDILKGPDGKDLKWPDGKPRSRFEVELGVVTRVYFARSFETTIEADVGASVGGKPNGPSNGKPAAGEAEGAEAPKPAEAPETAEGDQAPKPGAAPAGVEASQDAEKAKAAKPAAAERRIADQRRGLATTLNSSGPGSAVAQRSTSSGILITQTFQRPIAIGFRSIRRRGTP